MSETYVLAHRRFIQPTGFVQSFVRKKLNDEQRFVMVDFVLIPVHVSRQGDAKKVTQARSLGQLQHDRREFQAVGVLPTFRDERPPFDALFVQVFQVLGAIARTVLVGTAIAGAFVVRHDGSVVRKESDSRGE